VIGLLGQTTIAWALRIAVITTRAPAG
jgi:hypothetical protein